MWRSDSHIHVMALVNVIAHRREDKTSTGSLLSTEIANHITRYTPQNHIHYSQGITYRNREGSGGGGHGGDEENLSLHGVVDCSIVVN